MKEVLTCCTGLDEWMISTPEHIQKISSEEVYKIEGTTGNIFLVYKIDMSKTGKLKPIMTDRSLIYEIKVLADLKGELVGEVGVTCYFNREASKTKYYELNQPIRLSNCNIEEIFLTLKLTGTGTIQFNQVILELQHKSESIDDKACAEKIKQFYKWYQSQNQRENSIRPSFNIRIATIVDEFTYHCFKYEAYLKQLTYKHWEEEMEEFKPQILFVESAWEGENRSWAGKIARYRQDHDLEVLKLIKYCNKHHISTVFWDKESMHNLYYFVHTSDLFDYIFVTDENMIEIYEAINQVNRVEILPFAAQPRLHHTQNHMVYPLGEVAFAGAWYGEKYPSRLQDIKVIVEPALEYGLDIYDRNDTGDKKSIESSEKWPEKYAPHIVGSLPYLMMIEAYKQYNIFLNIQSVKESKWMIPRRIYELLACGIPVISSDSKGIRHQFAKEVYISDSPEKTKEWIRWILDNPRLAQVKAEEGRKKVLAMHTYTHRIQQILNKIGVKM